ncbi:MAG TPA: peptidase M17 [Anaeromyxobacteraceae bacterium]|nr:peptidase M17 [Anaeromyxobacteraceae bacterium]
MALRVETADLGLASLDALEADALAVPVGPGRPLGGLAAFVDWRLCGAIARAVRGGLFSTEAEEALLVPTGRRLRVPRVFCFGLARDSLDEAGFAAAARRVCDAMARAGSRAFAGALPRAEPGVAAARLWLEAALARPPERLVLLGDGRALARALEAARDELGADVEVAFSPPRAETSARAVGLPVRSAVVR